MDHSADPAGLESWGHTDGRATRGARRIAIVPAYNEEGSVAVVLSAVYPHIDLVVVVNDGSTDGTAAELAAWQPGHDRALIITLPVNQGVSAAYRAALEVLEDRLSAGELTREDLVFTIDADGQHDVADMERLGEIAESESLDAVVARRALAYQTPFKRFGNRAMSLWASLWAGRRLYDVECGYRVVRLGALLDAMQYIRGFRYSQPAQSAVVMSRLGYRIRNDVGVNVPVARSRTTMTTAMIHAVAIPWSAIRVLFDPMGRTRRSSDGTAHHLSDRIRWLGLAVAAVTAARVVVLAGAVMGLLAAVLALGGFSVAVRRVPTKPSRACAFVLAPVELWLAGALWGRSPFTVVAALGTGFTAGLIVAPTSSPIRRRRARSLAFAATVVVVWALSLVWSGANNPAAAWLAQTTSHGSRHSPTVAITFDDGPNDSSTVAIAQMLHARGIRGTFFMVGAAVDARPDIVRAVVAADQIVGSHSYHHRSGDWLAPGYPELARGEQAFARVLGRCPALFRPPNGRHTPFMSNRANDMGIEIVTWDVSGHDWDTNNAALVAHRVLSRVKPGSIILLHDGSNGHPEAPRPAVVAETELILDGLAAKGLQPVGLDELLGEQAWLPVCPKG